LLPRKELRTENASLVFNPGLWETIMTIESNSLVDDVMRRWPVTIRVFLRYKMHCVGCPIACFHAVDDACREHGTDCDSFLADLRTAIGMPEA
jgi:hybrid cluster-associated redox disulfide protein